MFTHYDAIVIGGGAAGLMTAWHAGLRGKRVAVLESSKRVGRKILMSGGGRCNFTNLNISTENFICANQHFVKSALSQYTADDFISSVEEHNIAYHERDHGQLFCDDSAKDIVKLLLTECANARVDILNQCAVHSIRQKPAGNFSIETGHGLFQANSVVIATGGLSIPSMLPTPFGYEVAKQFGMQVLPIRASLVPYTFSGDLKDMFARLAGNAVNVCITCGQHAFTEAMLFTHRGLSGPSVLQISNYWPLGEPVEVDLLPQHDLQQVLLDAKAHQPKALVRTVIANLLPKSLVQALEALWWQSKSAVPLANWRDDDIVLLATKFKHWRIVPAGTEGYRTAEVTLGGVNTDDLSSKTMESRTCAGLYFVGEVVDVTGHLGGYNFQWAWSSGFACAQAL